MNRINIISKKIPDNASVIDIGCDHAYLGIELLKQNRNIHVVASDVSKNACESAINNIKKEHLNIDVRCGNGLDVIDKNEIDTIVIAGMGSHNQIDILTSGIDKLNSVETIILCPNDSAFYVRSNIDKIGYYIYDEDIIYENDIYYPILILKKGIKKYTYSDMLLGPILKNRCDDIVLSYYKQMLRKKEYILSNLKSNHIEKKEQITNDIDIIKNSIKR